MNPGCRPGFQLVSLTGPASLQAVIFVFSATMTFVRSSGANPPCFKKLTVLLGKECPGGNLLGGGGQVFFHELDFNIDRLAPPPHLIY